MAEVEVMAVMLGLAQVLDMILALVLVTVVQEVYMEVGEAIVVEVVIILIPGRFLSKNFL